MSAVERQVQLAAASKVGRKSLPGHSGELRKDGCYGIGWSGSTVEQAKAG